MNAISSELLTRFQNAVSELDTLFDGKLLEDENIESSVRQWLNGDATPLPWTVPDRITPDEWFFITTLYGEMTAEGQRTHIRKFFPSLFVTVANRDIRNFVHGMNEYRGLRSPWMSQRLYRMGQILRERNISMTEYVDYLRQLELKSKPENPMPALDTIVLEHRANGWKTLSVFIRDCVRANCFPIDSRVRKNLMKYSLPEDERKLVSLALTIERNPRQVARMFYEASPA